MTDLVPIILGIARPELEPGAGNPLGKGGAKSTKKPPKPKAGDAPLATDGKLTPEVKRKVFERDNFSCRCCGFKSEKYQEVHFLDHDKKNLHPSNLITACIFCHQCFNLQDVSDMRSGMLLWLPEISQADLHHIARAVYVARISQGPVAEAARKILDTLMERRNEAKRRISTDDPYILSMVLKDYLGAKHYTARAKKLDGVRLFPLDRRIIKEADLEFNQFPQILAYWRSKTGPFGGKVPQQWISIYQSIAA